MDFRLASDLEIRENQEKSGGKMGQGKVREFHHFFSKYRENHFSQ